MTAAPILSLLLAAGMQNGTAPSQDNAAQPAPPPIIAVPPIAETPDPAPVERNGNAAVGEPVERAPAERDASPARREPGAPVASQAPAVVPAPAAAPRTPAPSAPVATEAPPAAAPPIRPVEAVRREPSSRAWLLAAAAVLAAAMGAAFLLLRRRGTVSELAPTTVDIRKEGAPGSLPFAPRARVEVAFQPARAGLNLLSATAEGAFIVTNVGDLPARDLRLGALLLAAHAGQERELAELWAEGVERPVVPPFALEPGEERVIPQLLTLPRAAIQPMAAAGRPMFVPVVAISAVYDRGDGTEGQAGRAWVVGVQRADSAKLAPLWLDELPRMRDGVAARPHAAHLDR